MRTIGDLVDKITTEVLGDEMSLDYDKVGDVYMFHIVDEKEDEVRCQLEFTVPIGITNSPQSYEKVKTHEVDTYCYGVFREVIFDGVELLNPSANELYIEIKKHL